MEIKSEPLTETTKASNGGSGSDSKSKDGPGGKKGWMTFQETLNTGIDQDEPLGTPFTESAAEKKKYIPMIRIDAFEPEEGEISESKVNKMDVDSDDDEETFARATSSKKPKGRNGVKKEEEEEEKERTLRMYWLDYLETDGVVHLIGKVMDRNSGRFVSCCVTVKGMQRNLFVLPRAKMFGECEAASSESMRLRGLHGH